jgi:PAS domain S-box-containing protein
MRQCNKSSLALGDDNYCGYLLMIGGDVLRPKQLLAILAIAGAYYLTALLGQSLALPQTTATAVWLPSGIALAALLLGGAGLWPGVALGALLVHAHVLFQAGAGSPAKILLAASVIAGGNTLEALLASLLFRRYIERPDPLHCSRDPLILAAIAAVSCTVAAAVGMTALTVIGYTPRQLAGPALLTWWLGDLAGILVIAPLVLVIASSPARTWNRRRRLAEGAFLVGAGLAAFVLFAGGIPHDLAASVAYLVLPLVLMAAIWGGPALTQLSVAMVAAVAIYGAVHGQGPFLYPSVYASLLLAQAFICVLALAGSTLAAAIAERQMREQEVVRLNEQVQRYAEELEQRVEQRTNQLQQEIAEREQAQTSLRESEREYRELVENANSIILRMDTHGRITFLNEFGQRFFGYEEAELLGRSVIGTIVPRSETGGRDLEQLIQDIATHPERHANNENEIIRRDGTRAWISWTNRPIDDGKGRMVECLSVGNDITPMKQAEAQLERAKEAAESADRLKSAFLATMSHELRTPLNSIIGFTGILLQGLAGPLNGEQGKQLGMVQNAARHLLALITDVLDISKIEAGQLTIQRTPFSLPSAIDKAMKTVTPLAQSKNLQLVCQVAPDVREFVGDQRRVEQVLLNLLSNAIKFTEQGEVTLCCTREPGWVLISVRDTGCGIAEEDRDTLFRPFRQLDTGLARKHEGTGLGLAICKRLVDLMDGQVELSSVVGKGSDFTVRLPQPEEPVGLKQSQQENL